MSNPTIPHHVYRARWLTTLITSLTSPILYRPLRDRHHSLTLQRHALDVEISKLTRAASDIWSYPRLLSFFTSYLTMHDFVISQYAEVMKSLTPPNKLWEKRQWVFRKSLVKKVCVLHQYAWVLLYSFDDVFGECGEGMDWVWKCGALRTPGLLRRRWSEGDIGH